MEDIINSLDDVTVLRVLEILGRQQQGAEEIKPTAEVRQALEDSFAVAKTTTRPSNGELARAALLVICEGNPAIGERIRTLVTTGQLTQSFEPVTTVALIAVTLVVLQTHVRFKRNASGKIEILVEKTSTKDDLLKQLVQKLVNYLP